jgi:hypothetical protein
MYAHAIIRDAEKVAQTGSVVKLPRRLAGSEAATQLPA